MGSSLTFAAGLDEDLEVVSIRVSRTIVITEMEWATDGSSRLVVACN